MDGYATVRVDMATSPDGPPSLIDPTLSGWQMLFKGAGGEVSFPKLPLPVRRDGVLVAEVTAVEQRGEDWWGFVVPLHAPAPAGEEVVAAVDAVVDGNVVHLVSKTTGRLRATLPRDHYDAAVAVGALHRPSALVPTEATTGPTCDWVEEEPLDGPGSWSIAWSRAAQARKERRERIDVDAALPILVTAQPSAAENGVYLVRRDGEHQRAVVAENGRSWKPWQEGVDLAVGDTVRVGDETYEVVSASDGTASSEAPPTIRREFVSYAPGTVQTTKAQLKKILVGEWSYPKPPAKPNRHQRRAEEAQRRRAR